jgi:hypothetical protein
MELNKAQGQLYLLHTPKSVIIHLRQPYLQTSASKKCFEVKKQVKKGEHSLSENGVGKWERKGEEGA